MAVQRRYLLPNAVDSVTLWFSKSGCPLRWQRHQVDRLRTPFTSRLQKYSKQIRGADKLTPPKGVSMEAAREMARWAQAKRIRLDDPDFTFEALDSDLNDGPSRQRRAKQVKFAAVLQRLILKHEHWDGTKRV